jgi:hypothetical protein
MTAARASALFVGSGRGNRAVSGDVSDGDLMMWHLGRTQHPGCSKFGIDQI